MNTLLALTTNAIQRQQQAIVPGWLERFKSSLRFLGIAVLLPLVVLGISLRFPILAITPIIALYCIAFLPGYLVAQGAWPWLSRIELGVLGSLLSMFFVPIGPYLILSRGQALTAQSTLIALTVTVVLAASFWLLRHTMWGTTVSKKVKLRSYLPTFAAVLLFSAQMGVLLSIYPLLVEADPYGFYTVVEKLVQTGLHPQLTYRPFFGIILTQLEYLGNISLWTSFKYVLAFLPIFLVLLVSDTLRSRDVASWQQVILSLTFLTVPMFFLETEIIRPQVFVLTGLPLALYFLSRAIDKQSITLWFVIFILSVLSVKYHEMGLFIFASSLASLPFVVRIKLQDIRWKHVGLALILGLLIWGNISDFVTTTLRTSADFLSAFRQTPNFRIWYLHDMRNIDGTYVSWTGFGVLQYYGYVLGALIPILLVFGWRRTILREIFHVRNTPFFVSFGLFFTLAEIFPRLDINFLPDRAWLFALASLFSLFPLLGLRLLNHSRFGIAMVVVSMLISFGGSYYVALTKQGYVSKNELMAAEFLREQTPNNSLILTQGGNNVLVTFFGKRAITTYRPIFFKESAVQHEDIENFFSETTQLPVLRQQQEDLARQFETQKTILAQNTKDDAAVVSAATALVQMSQQKRVLLDEIKEQEEVAAVPFYILFSQDKLNTIYSQRAWWREGNYAGANLAALEQSPVLEKVYSNDTVTIWRVHR